jgi:TonB family protein
VDSSKTVTFSIVVGEDGEPRDIKVKAGALGGTLDEEAREALTKWYFAPAMKDGQPVAVRIDVSFTATHTAEGGFGWGAGWPFGQDN